MSTKELVAPSAASFIGRGAESTSSLSVKQLSHKTKKKKRKIIKEEAVEVVKKSSFDVPGVATIILSPIPQKIIGCSVGENVTAENPWIYVRKELIEDNMELHEESSEFLALGNEIRAYPEPDILIGWIPAASEKHDEFYVIYTLEAKEQVLKVIEQKKNEMEQKLQRLVCRTVGKWKSLGSEYEVNESLILNFRPLYEVEIKSQFPVYAAPVKFIMRKVEDAIDGYVELLQDVRYPIESVAKKRVDVSVQAALPRVSNEVQTNPTFPRNVSTQYEFNYDMLKTSTKDRKPKMLPSRKVSNLPIILSNTDEVFENVFFNEHMDIYKDDYAALISESRLKLDVTGNIHRFLTCSDPNSTKGKLVGDCAWSYFTSGLMAVCYTDYCPATLSRKKDEDEVASSVDGAPPVLIWSYTDGLQPKLYLETPREITYLSWCPYQKDLLIGGSINGQIIVWDLTNKIKEVETPEILTTSQKQHRLNLLTRMGWMKFTGNISVVQPSIVSNLCHSHKSSVTGVTWLSENCEITRNGKYRCSEGSKTKQLISFSEDGTLLVWDMDFKRTNDVLPKTGGRKLKRLKELPLGLVADLTNLKELGKDFKPHYKITMKELPILTIVRMPMVTEYKPVEDYEDPRPQIRTEYTNTSEQLPTEMQQFTFATTIGQLINAKIEGFDFDVGTKMSTEEATIEYYQSMHEGPIVFCGKHPTIKDYLLTIGGTVFTIWHSEEKHPILWRKASYGLKYNTGGWMLRRPACILLVRSDGSLEMWDLLINNIQPIRVVSTGGDMLLKSFGFLSAVHPRKSTFAFSDNLGTLSVYFVPEIFNHTTKNEHNLTQILLDRSYQRRILLRNWMEKFGETVQQRDEETCKLRIDSILRAAIKAKSVSNIRIDEKKYFSEIDKMNKIFEGVHWKSKEERYMFQTMLNRKRLNLRELEVYKETLQQQEREKKEKLLKQHQLIENKNHIFIHESSKVFERRGHFDHQRKYSLQTAFGFEHIGYIDDYDRIESGALYFIETHNFEPKFEWSKLLNRKNKFNKYIQNWLKFSKSKPVDEPTRKFGRKSIFQSALDSVISRSERSDFDVYKNDSDNTETA